MPMVTSRRCRFDKMIVLIYEENQCNKRSKDYKGQKADARDVSFSLRWNDESEKQEDAIAAMTLQNNQGMLRGVAFAGVQVLIGHGPRASATIFLKSGMVSRPPPA